MIRRSMSRRELRIVIAGGSFIAASLIASRGVPNWLRRIHQNNAASASLILESRRAEQLVRNLPQAMDTLESRQQQFIGLAPFLLVGQSRTTAEGELATLISSTALSSRVRLGSILVTTDSVSGQGIRAVSARASVVGDIRGVTAFLIALEGGPELVSIREIAINQPEPASPDDRPEALQVDLVVAALFLRLITRDSP